MLPDFSAMRQLLGAQKNTEIMPISALFAEDAQRLERFTFEVEGIFFDFSKTHLSPTLIENLSQHAEAQALATTREALFNGEIINISEQRAALHAAERGQGQREDVLRADNWHMRAAVLADVIRQGLLGEIRHIIHIGIGGSALGPELVISALKDREGALDVHVVGNIDGMALEAACNQCDPAYTLLVVVSKSFTTTETLINAESAMQWMEAAGIEDAYGRVVAITAQPDKAIAWGVDETRVLPFDDAVGGRYSLWSSVGFTISLALGQHILDELRAGACAMDQHFRTAALAHNAPVLAAWSDIFYALSRSVQTRAMFAYDERLRLLLPYIQQLEMESNGKRTRQDGHPVEGSAAVIWGGVGTESQHAVFQYLHQGAPLVPVEFIAVLEAGDTLDAQHHDQLLANCLAQGAALMSGAPSDDPVRDCPGDRPSHMILLPRLDAWHLGLLLAFYEHRTFVEAMILGINPFDQFGVELGKRVAHDVVEGVKDKLDPSTRALMARIWPYD